MNNFTILGIEKLGLLAENTDVRLVLDEDGTEVDAEYLPFVQANTILILLTTQEHWSSSEGYQYIKYSLYNK